VLCRLRDTGRRLQRLHVYVRPLALLVVHKFDVAIHQGEQRVILPHANVLPWVKLGAPLPHDDVPWATQLAAIQLHTQVFGVGILVILRRATLLFGSPSALLQLARGQGLCEARRACNCKKAGGWG